MCVDTTTLRLYQAQDIRKTYVVLQRRRGQVSLWLRVRQQPKLAAARDGRAAGRNVELGEDVRHVATDRAPAEREHLSNLLVGTHPGQQAEDLPLSGGQPDRPRP